MTGRSWPSTVLVLQNVGSKYLELGAAANQSNKSIQHNVRLFTKKQVWGLLVIIRFRDQFGINLHEWVFQKAEIARAASASAISVFWKTHKGKLIPNWTRKTIWLLINNINMKKRSFLKPFFSHSRKLFSKSLSNLSSSFYVISLA